MSPPARRAALLALLPAAFCALLLWAADPRGDFPLNDDFQWADAVFRLAAGGGLHFCQWVYASAVTHVLLGALPALLFGPTDWVLRLWNMAWGCAAASGVFLLARRFGAAPAAALAAGCALAGDPLHLVMSASFHMEVTLMVCLLLSAWGFLAHLEGGPLAALAASSAALGLAALTRQTAAAAAPGMALVLLAAGLAGRRRALALALPLGLLLAAWQAWYRLVHGPTWGALTLRPSLGPHPLLWGARRVADVLQTAGLLLVPVTAAALPAAARLPRPARGEALALAALALSALDVWATRGMPAMTNTLQRAGLGVVTIDGAPFKEAGWWSSPALWALAAAAALASSAVMLRILWPRAGEADGPRRGRALLAMAAGPVLGTALLAPNLDRHMLAWLPLALLAGAWAAGERGRPALGLAAALVMGCWSAAGVRDYFAWNRARWEAGRRAVARGVPPGKVANGFDWDGRLTLEPNMRRLLAERAPRDIGMWDWMALNRIVALTSFSPRPPRADFVLIDSVPYRTPFARGERRVYLYALAAAGR